MKEKTQVTACYINNIHLISNTQKLMKCSSVKIVFNKLFLQLCYRAYKISAIYDFKNKKHN